MGSKRERGADKEYARATRRAFIDEELYWNGIVTRGSVMDAFNVSEETAKTDIRDYRAGYAPDLVLDKEEHVYKTGIDFALRYVLAPDPEGWLTRLAAARDPAIPIAGVPEVQRRAIDPAVLRRIVRAVRQGVELLVDYRSARDPAARARWIRPCAFMHDGLRWSVRCFQHRAGGGGFWGEMVLDRIEGVAVETRAPDPAVGGRDEEWEARVELVLVPNPRLSPAERGVIEAQHGMAGGCKTVSVRQCMLAYFLKRYQLDEPVTLKAPHQAPLALRDRLLADLVPDAMRVPLETTDAPAPRLMRALRTRLPGLTDQEILERALADLESTIRNPPSAR